ncbi:MAG: glycosyltransferase [Chthoniobacter sp.]
MFPAAFPDQTDTLFKLIAPIARQIWSQAAVTTAVSTFVQELAVAAYHRPVVRILNGIDLRDAPPPPAAIRHTRHLVFVGRFNPQKNLPLLINALARLSETNWRATLVGDGPDRATVEALIDQHQLRDRIALPGWQSADQVAAILNDADILCMPSASEGLPVAAVEALKHGLAIVTSEIPGVRDVVDHGVNGLPSAPRQFLRPQTELAPRKRRNSPGDETRELGKSPRFRHRCHRRPIRRSLARSRQMNAAHDGYAA